MPDTTQRVGSADTPSLAAAAAALELGSELDWNADHLAESAWIEHVPFAFWIVKALRPHCLVELGTQYGVSYLAFCQAVERLQAGTRCYAVDTWEGDRHTGTYDSTVYGVVAEVQDRRYRRFSTLLRTTFSEALPYFAEGEIDLLHIDGLHTYEAVAEDFRSWRPKLSRRAVVLFHDVNVREREFGVWRLWHELRAQHPHFAFTHGHGLGVLGLGEDLPETLHRLFAAALQPEEAAAIRDIFAARGSAQKDRMLLLQARQREQQLLSASERALQETRAAAERQLTEALTEATRAAEQRLRDIEEQLRAARERQAALEEALSDREIRLATLENKMAREESERAPVPELAQEAPAAPPIPSGPPAQPARLRFPASYRRWRERRLVMRSELFDPAWYLQHYPDVAAAGADPARHYLRFGVAEGRDPGPGFSTSAYLAANPDVARSGVNPLVHYLRFGRAEGRPMRPSSAPAPPAPVTRQPQTVQDLLRERFPDLQPLLAYPEPRQQPRITMVTDSIGPSSLFGGVGTAIILAALLAKRLDAPLRVATRTEAPVPANFGAVLAAHGVPYDRNVEFLRCSIEDGQRGLPLGPGDIVLTTSWWSTWATRAVVPPERIVYLLQEDERMFYPAGDDALRCAEVLDDPRLRFVVNTEMLRQHFITEGLRGAGNGSIAFEPAFPATIYYPEPLAGHRRRFFFYARPHNPRNLFHRGIEALSTAIESGILPADEWEFFLVGRDVPDVVLPAGATVHRPGSMPWSDYARLVRSVKLGLSLMATPHPSYPPLDLAASGAVVVTNRHGTKTSLARYSPNILCVEPSVDGLCAGLREAAALAADEQLCIANHRASGLCRDWSQALAPVLEALVPAG